MAAPCSLSQSSLHLHIPCSGVSYMWSSEIMSRRASAGDSIFYRVIYQRGTENNVFYAHKYSSFICLQVP